MNKLIKFSGAVAVASSLLIAGSVFAAGNLTYLTVDGKTNTTVSEGSSVTAKVTFETTSSTDVESMSWELVGSGLPQTCVDVSDRITDGTFTSSFDIDTTGASEGTWDVRIRAYGDDGSDASNLCETTDQVDSQSFTDRITVTDSNNDNQDNTGGTNSNTPPSWFTEWLKTQNGGSMGQTPAMKAKCDLIKPYLGAPEYQYSAMGTQLQSTLLLDNPYSIPALKPGATIPMGYFGPQTHAALSLYNSANKCN